MFLISHNHRVFNSSILFFVNYILEINFNAINVFGDMTTCYNITIISIHNENIIISNVISGDKNIHLRILVYLT